MSSSRERVRQLAQEFIAKGSPLGWFEVLYDTAQGDANQIPWADGEPNRNLTTWLDRQQVHGQGQKALVVGCGLGEDAEYLAQLGFAVTAFDIAPTAIRWSQERFPISAVDYVVGDVLALAESWQKQFAFILEAYTLQVLPAQLRPQAMRQIAGCLSAGGVLLVIARGREPDEAPGLTPPWPLTHTELAYFQKLGLDEIQFEDYLDGETRRFRVQYRPSAPHERILL